MLKREKLYLRSFLKGLNFSTNFSTEGFNLCRFQCLLKAYSENKNKNSLIHQQLKQMSQKKGELNAEGQEVS